MMEILQEKMKEVDNDTLTRYLKLTTNRIAKEELALLSDRMTEYTRMITIYLFDVKNRGESFDYIKVPQVVEAGWYVFKLCPMTMDKNEKKRVTLKSFDDCLQEKTMEELPILCRTVYEKLRDTHTHTCCENVVKLDY